MDICSMFESKKDSLPEPPNVFGKPTGQIGFENILITIPIDTIIRLTLLLICQLNWVRNYEC